MWYLILSFFILLLSICLGIEISKVNNYFLVVYDHWVIESSLWVVLLGILILFIVLYVLMRVLANLTTATRKYRYWKMTHRYRKAQILTQHGLCDLAEGEWHQAEGLLLKAAKLSKRPLINYLSAAKAAQAQEAYDRRDNYLRCAYRADKAATVAIGLTQAQLQMESEQWEQALATLQHLYQREPAHAHVLKLLIKVYLQLGEWRRCEKLLPIIKRRKVISEKDRQQLERKVYMALLAEAQQKELSILLTYWQSLPRSYQQDPEFLQGYLVGLLAKQQDEDVIASIEAFLKKTWCTKLVTLYAEARAKDTNQQLQTAEHWLKKHPNDVALLMCLAQLSLRVRLWGRAKEYLQQCITIKPSVRAYVELGKLYELLHDHQQAQQSFHAALALCLKDP